MEHIEYQLHEDNLLYRHFSITTDDGRVIASGDVGIDENELLEVYNTNPELALQDARINDALNPPETVIAPTEEELLQAELLLNQVDIIAKQNEQDEVLATILLNQMEV